MLLEDVIEKACRELPLNFNLAIYIENGYAGISIYGPGGERYFDGTDMDLDTQVLEAIAITKKEYERLFHKKYAPINSPSVGKEGE